MSMTKSFVLVVLFALLAVAMGSGSNLWRVRLGDNEFQMNPIPHAGTPVDWYGYNNADGTVQSALTKEPNYVSKDRQTMALVETSEGLFLAFVFDKLAGYGDRGFMDMSIRCGYYGCADATFVVKDDISDFQRSIRSNKLCSDGSAELSFNWGGFTYKNGKFVQDKFDGFMLGPLHGCFDLQVQPTAMGGWNTSQVASFNEVTGQVDFFQSTASSLSMIHFEGCEAACEAPVYRRGQRGMQDEAIIMSPRWNIQFVRRVYDIVTHTTTFVYSVESNPCYVVTDIHHWVLGTRTRLCRFELDTFTPNSWTVVTNITSEITHQAGFRSNMGFKNVNVPVEMSLRLKGKVYACAVPYAAAGYPEPDGNGNMVPKYATGTILGPCCGWAGCGNVSECRIVHPDNPINENCQKSLTASHVGEKCVTLCFNSEGQVTPCINPTTP